VDIINNEWIKILVTPLILFVISEGMLLLGKHDPIGPNDFASVPYAILTAAIASNAVFAMSKPNLIEAFNFWSSVLFACMIIIALAQKLIPRFIPVVHIACMLFAIALLSITFIIWK